MRFYQRLLPPRGLANGYVALLDAIDIYEARALAAATPGERVAMFAKRAEVRKLLRWMWREYEQVGVGGAVKADQLIRARIRSTAVRPPTSGRMEAAITSRPIGTTWPAGALGIADLDVLDAGAVRPGYEAAGTYWRTQEYGYGGHVGRRIPGYFQHTLGTGQPGSRPSGAEFRVHPYFEPATGRGTPAMVIKRPIEARHFMRDGTDDVVAWRRLEMARINRHAISVLAAL